MTVLDSDTKAPFPDFFTRDSGVRASHVVQGSLQAADMIHVAQQLGAQTGLLFAVPIPRKQEASGKAIKEVTYRLNEWLY